MEIATRVAQNVVAQQQQAQQQQAMPAQSTLETVAKGEAAKGENSDIFAKYEAEIEATVNQTTPDLRTSVDVWRNASAVVFGKHINEITEMRAQKEGKPKAPSAGPSAPTGASAPSPKANTANLSAEQLDMAEKLGLSAPQYAEGLKHVDNPSGIFKDRVTYSRLERARRPGTGEAGTIIA